MIPPESLTPVYEKDDWTVYELGSSVPKAVLASRYSITQTKEAFGKRYFDPSFDPENEVILENPPAVDPSGEGEGLVRIDSYAPQTISITTSALSPKLLVLSDTYYPGWTAAVDGRLTPIYRANYTMRAISVPSGNHTVTFTYEPASVRIGFMISIASLLVLIIWMYSRYKANEKL